MTLKFWSIHWSDKNFIFEVTKYLLWLWYVLDICVTRRFFLHILVKKYIQLIIFIKIFFFKYQLGDYRWSIIFILYNCFSNVFVSYWLFFLCASLIIFSFFYIICIVRSLDMSKYVYLSYMLRIINFITKEKT